MAQIDPQMLDRLETLAQGSETPVAEMSMEEIASGLGITRMTLYRRAGKREDIVAALEARGIDARRLPDVYERVIEATSRLLREQPIATLTLEQIAEAAHCSLPAIFARFGNRQGVLKAVIERHSPLIPVKAAIASNMDPMSADLRHDVRVLYQTLYRKLDQEWRLLSAFLAELLRDPNSEVGHAVRDWYVPQVREALVPLIQRHIARGTMRPLPVAIVVAELAAPVGFHVATRSYIERQTDLDLPNADDTVDLFTDMFCRAVATDGPPTTT